MDNLENKKSILVVILNQGEIATTLCNSINVMSNNPNYNVVIEYADDKPISQNRNKIVQRFLSKSEYDYLMMIDSDIVPPPSVVHMADFEKDVMGATCFMWREGRPHAVIFRRREGGLYSPIDIEKKDGVIEVDAIGTGCIILSRKVLETVKAPFVNEYDPDGIKLYGLDIAFCRKAREKGFKIYANLDYLCDHWVRLNIKQMYGIVYGLVEEVRKLEMKEWDMKWKEFLRNNEYVKMDGHRFLLPKEDESDIPIKVAMEDYGKISSANSVWEPETTELVKYRLKEGQVAVDIGASIGYFTNLFARQVGEKGKVFSFEPTPNQFPYLKENIKANGYEDRVIAYQMAAWDKKEKVKMPPIDKTYECDAITVDEVLEKHGVINKVNFIKIDVDGSEPQVLKGLTKTFEKNKNLEMIFEYYPDYIKKLGGSPEEVKKFIEKYFTVKVIEKLGGVNTEDHWNWHCIRKQ